jgi:hypothetical protein
MLERGRLLLDMWRSRALERYYTCHARQVPGGLEMRNKSGRETRWHSARARASVCRLGDHHGTAGRAATLRKKGHTHRSGRAVAAAATAAMHRPSHGLALARRGRLASARVCQTRRSCSAGFGGPLKWRPNPAEITSAAGGTAVARFGRMESLRTVTPVRCTCWAVSVMLAGSVLSTHRDAHACGETPFEAQAALPLDGATNVPLNAVLITSANVTDADFELREVAAATAGVQAQPLEPPADAGATAVVDAGAASQVALDVDCSVGAAEGALCTARPREPLKPDTRYAWRTAPDGYVPPSALDVWREFTTGSALDDQPLSADAVGFVVTDSYRSSDPSPCGITHSTTIAYSLRASEPAVLQYAGYTPSYVMHATLLVPGEDVSATLYNPPDCLSPVLYDAAGHRTPLSEWCPSGSTPAPPSTEENARDDQTPSGSSSDRAPSTPAEATASEPGRALCALSTPPLSTHGGLPTLGGLGALLLLLSQRRRRTP